MNKNTTAKKVLGRGLSDLFTDKMSLISNHDTTSGENSEVAEGLLYLDISFVKPCPTQPRKIFDQDGLNELSESIKAHGVLQPIVVRQKNSQGFYEIIAGERRWKASILAGQKKIPAIVKTLDDHNAFLLSIIENLQRMDLSPIEEAETYQRLMDDGYTHEQIALMLNKSRPYISNSIRLITLSDRIKNLVNNKSLTIGHAKILLGLENQDEIAEQIVEKNLTIRQTEDLIKKYNYHGDIKLRKNSNNNELKEVEELIYNNVSFTTLNNEINSFLRLMYQSNPFSINTYISCE